MTGGAKIEEAYPYHIAFDAPVQTWATRIN